ncbi:MAG: hypothetical protein ABSA68_12475 [Xanthobacteraceae bacterium]
MVDPAFMFDEIKDSAADVGLMVEKLPSLFIDGHAAVRAVAQVLRRPRKPRVRLAQQALGDRRHERGEVNRVR